MWRTNYVVYTKWEKCDNWDYKCNVRDSVTTVEENAIINKFVYIYYELKFCMILLLLPLLAASVYIVVDSFKM
jgi:hypothetical protein